jgi:FkbM family methyltransferase
MPDKKLLRLLRRVQRRLLSQKISRLVKTFYLRRLHSRTFVYDGVSLHFPPNVGDAILWGLCWDGMGGFEPDTWATLRRLVAGAKVFLDIGSNIGMYSVLVPKIVPDIQVIAFEPQPALRDAHRRFCEANGVTVEFVSLALSDANGTATLYVPTEDESKGTATIASASWQARKPHDEISIRTMSLDAFLAGRPLRTPVVIKIDVEDHEAAVLRGAAETIARYRPAIICEIWPNQHRDPNNPNDTIAVIEDLGYVAFAIKSNGYFRFSAEDFARPRAFYDFLLIPRERADKLDTSGPEKHALIEVAH